MPKGDFTKTKDSIVPLRGVVRDGKLAALLDQEGKEIGMPVTAIESVTGRIEELFSGRTIIRPVALSESFRRSRMNNPRVRPALTVETVAFGGTPTAGVVGTANSGITITGWNYYDIKAGEGSVLPFRIFGARPFYGSGYKIQGESYKNSAGTRQQAVWRLVFETDAPEAVINAKGESSVYKCLVDGQRCGAITNGSAGGHINFSINLRGLGAGFHRVEILLALDDVVAGIYVPKSSSFVAIEDRPLVAVFTDSLGSTSPDGNPVDCFPSVMSDYLGAEVWLFAAGGTGYTSADTKETFAQRIPLAVAALPRKPALVVFAGGINDTDNAAFQPAVESTIALAKSTWNCPIAVFGSWANRTTVAQTAKIAQEAKIKAAATSAGAVFVPTMTDPLGAWITGTGNVSAPAGNGTADVMFGSVDSAHWLAAGHAIVGRKAAHALAAALGL